MNLPTMNRLLAMLLLAAAILHPRCAQALIEGTDRERVNLRDDGTSPTITWSPGLDRRADGIYVQARAPQNWIVLPPMTVGKETRPAREALVTSTIALDGIDIDEFWVFIRHSADGKHWSSWTHVPLKSRQPGMLTFRADLRIPLAGRANYEKRMVEWVSGGGNPRDEQHLFAKWIQRRDPGFFEREIPYIRHIQFRLEIEKPRRLGLVRQVDVETHWTARIDGE